MQPISGLVITYNEAGNVRACLESLQAVCAEVIVVDSGSTDDTVAIAQACGAKVYSQPFLGYGPQKNFGVSLCQYAWVLSLDADERLDADAIRALQALDLAHSPYEAYEFRRKNLFHGRWVKCTAWYPDHVRRLFNRTKVQFSDVQCHEKIDSRHNAQLDAHILHYSYRDYAHILHKLNQYSSQYADEAFTKGKARVNAWSPPLHGLFAFLKNYFLKRGFLCGFDGFTISVLNALGSYMKYAKLLEKQRYGQAQQPQP